MYAPVALALERTQPATLLLRLVFSSCRPRRESAADWLRPLTVAPDTTLRKDPVGCDRLRSLTITTLRKDLLPDFRRERRSMQQCNSRFYPRNPDKISLSRAPTTIYIILPFRWFLFLIDRGRRSMQQCNSRFYPRNSDKISLSRAQNKSLRHFTVLQLFDMDFDGTRIPMRGCARLKNFKRRLPVPVRLCVSFLLFCLWRVLERRGEAEPLVYSSTRHSANKINCY